MEDFGKLIIILLVFTTITILTGFVFTKLWHWFIVPIFGMEDLRVIEGIGIVFIINFLKTKMEIDDDNFEEKLFVGVVLTVVWCLLALGFGYVISQFM